MARWEHDPAGQLSRQVDAAGKQLHWSYDPSGRVTGYGASEATEVNIERDLLDRTVAGEEPGLGHELAWDPLGRLVAERSGDLELAWRYDADGRQVSVNYPDGRRRSSPTTLPAS